MHDIVKQDHTGQDKDHDQDKAWHNCQIRQNNAK